MFDKFIVTNKGQEYIAKAAAGKTLLFTKGKFGNGQPTGAQATMTDIVSSLGTLAVSKYKSEGNQTIVTTQFSNRVNGSILPAFHLTEVGLYGKVQGDSSSPETLLLYATVPESQSDYIQQTLTEFILNWPITFSAESTINVEIDDSLAYPTLNDYNNTVSHKIAAEGTGGALTGTLDLDLVDELQVTVKIPEDLLANATLAINGGEAYPIKCLDGKPVKPGAKAGTWLTLIYSEEKAAWLMLGGGASIEIATVSDATKGIDDEKMMTPAKTKVYVDAVLGDVERILQGILSEDVSTMPSVSLVNNTLSIR